MTVFACAQPLQHALDAAAAAQVHMIVIVYDCICMCTVPTACFGRCGSSTGAYDVIVYDCVCMCTVPTACFGR